MIREGEGAPDFELATDRGEDLRLSDLRGRSVVLFFYPKDDTPGCTREACEFRDRLAGFDQVDAAVLGVSADGVDSHRRFRDKYDLTFPLLADLDGEVSRRYGVWGEKMLEGRPIEGIHRTTFLIDPEGRVERVWRKVRPEGHAEEVLEALRSAEGRTA